MENAVQVEAESWISRGSEAEGRGKHLFAFLAEFNLNNFVLGIAEWIMSNHNTSNA